MSNIEQTLKNYPILQAEINRLKLELVRMDSEYMGIKAVGADIKPSTSTNKICSSVESECIHREEHKQYIQIMIQQKSLDLEIIDNALSILTDEELQLITLRYFKKRKRDDVAELLEVSPRCVWSRTKEIINKLEPLIIM